MLYVEELIGADTVNTVPPATLDAFRDHGKLRDSLEENVDDAHSSARRARAGPAFRSMPSPQSWSRTACKLFADAADKLLRRGRAQARGVLGGSIDRQTLALGAGIEKAVEKSAEEWRAAGKVRRLWQQDKSVWTGDDENKWLGWLDQRRTMPTLPTTRTLRSA